MKKYILSLAVVALVLVGAATGATTVKTVHSACFGVQSGGKYGTGASKGDLNIYSKKKFCIVGKTGKAGAAGAAGAAGTNGTNGKDGTNGTNGKDGTNGTNGKDGTNGTNGKDGTNGTNGQSVTIADQQADCANGGVVFQAANGNATICNGQDGATGPPGPQGDPGTPAPTPQYAEGAVLVSRGGGNPAIWATDSTVLGSTLPGLGDTASGTFRFTCSAAKAPCVVTLEGAATEAGVTVYPRILIYKSDINTGQVFGQCEYGDGADNNGSYEAVGNGTLDPLTVGIGGSLDCGSSQTYPPNGTASEIDVPAGYYDVFTTFYFKTGS